MPRYKKRKIVVAKRRIVKKLENANCVLCNTRSNSGYLGQLFEKEITVHENCMFFSPLLHQEIDPSHRKRNYIIGFHVNKVLKESKRVSRLRCNICRNPNAGVGCRVETCRRSFHLECGVRANGVGIFSAGARQFEFYCLEHAPSQDLKDELKAIAKIEEVPECIICLFPVTEEGYEEAEEFMNIRKSPVLMNNEKVVEAVKARVVSNYVLHGNCCPLAWMHRTCARRYGLSAGLHHAKCPRCGNRSQFQHTIQSYGIWLPDRDAAWELEPGAFQEMYEEHPEETQENIECSGDVSVTYNNNDSNNSDAIKDIEEEEQDEQNKDGQRKPKMRVTDDSDLELGESVVFSDESDESKLIADRQVKHGDDGGGYETKNMHNYFTNVEKDRIVDSVSATCNSILDSTASTIDDTRKKRPRRINYKQDISIEHNTCVKLGRTRSNARKIRKIACSNKCTVSTSVNVFNRKQNIKKMVTSPKLPVEQCVVCSRKFLSLSPVAPGPKREKQQQDADNKENRGEFNQESGGDSSSRDKRGRGGGDGGGGGNYYFRCATCCTC